MIDVPIIMILGFTSVLLQFVIFKMIKKHNKEITDEIFEGVFFKMKKGYMKKVMLFYYNPMNWFKIKQGYLKLLLLMNLSIVIYVISFIFFIAP